VGRVRVRQIPCLRSWLSVPTPTTSTPNGMPIFTNGAMPSWLLEPTSIGLGVDAGNVCQYADCTGDPEAPGRLDEVTFLLERCYQADT
jgi:hypothetical protein